MITEFTKQLISIASVTPNDGGCMQLVSDRLEPSGFRTNRLKCADVDNLWLTHGAGSPVVSFLGHTDVVPPGPENEWTNNPFLPEIRDGMLYGRGAADMKGSVAAMVYALERFAVTYPDHQGTVALMLTSDEEGIAVNGTAKLVDYITSEGTKIDWCVVGEPSSRDRVGDMVKNGRRGSLTGHLTVLGIQGHVAYPEKAENPVHRVLPALDELCRHEWDRGNDHYGPTSFQISNIRAGSGTDNVIPGKVEVQFNIRYSTEVTEPELINIINEALTRHQLKFSIDWLPSSKPFLTEKGRLLEAVNEAIMDVTGYSPELSTAGGTSDGRFVAPTGTEVIELGPVNSTIHKVNECVSVKDLELLGEMYFRIMEKLLGNK